MTIGLVCLMLGSSIGYLAASLVGRTRPTPLVISTSAASSNTDPIATPGPWHIYVSGQVEAPAVYDLQPGSILQDAISAAGGFTGEARLEVVNLALPLSDGMHIHVPSVDDETQVPPVTSSNGSNPLATGVININNATIEELASLPGIGPGTAVDIINYRESAGPFSAITEIMNVYGIGQGKFDAIKNLIAIK